MAAPLAGDPWAEVGIVQFKGIVCTDGSGGKHTSSALKRRCGWAAVVPQPGIAEKCWPTLSGQLFG